MIIQYTLNETRVLHILFLVLIKQLLYIYIYLPIFYTKIKIQPFLRVICNFCLPKVSKRKFKNVFSVLSIFLPMSKDFTTIFTFSEWSYFLQILCLFVFTFPSINDVISVISLDWIHYKNLFPDYDLLVKSLNAYLRRLRYLLRKLKKTPKGSALYKALVAAIKALSIIILGLLSTLGLLKHSKYFLRFYYRLSYCLSFYVPFNGWKRLNYSRKNPILQLKKRYEKFPNFLLRLKIAYYTLNYKINTFFERNK